MTNESHIIVKIARSAEEVDAVFKGRHRVFAETDGYMKPSPDSRLYDRYDSYPTSLNVVAMVDGGAVGGMRITRPSAVGSSSEEAFDFSQAVPALSRDYVTASWFFLDRGFRKVSRAAQGIAALAYACAMEHGAKRLFCVLNPDVSQAALKIGFQALGKPRFDPHKQLPFIPMLMEFASLSEELRGQIGSLRATRRQKLDGLCIHMHDSQGIEPIGASEAT